MASKKAAPKTEVTTPSHEASEAPKHRMINLIVLHCSDSDNIKHDNIETIRHWHTQRGFLGPDGINGTEDDIGYHFVITKNGMVHVGRPIDKQGAHVHNHNEHSVGICLTGKTRSMFTPEQFKALKKLLLQLFVDHKLDWKSVRLHNQLDPNKTCPNFKMEDAVSG
jgi:N-acetylmuramoyl-L-alanine amidase